MGSAGIISISITAAMEDLKAWDDWQITARDKSNCCHYYIMEIHQAGISHWGWHKMAANFLTTFSNSFSWMKVYKFWLRFHSRFVLKGPIDNIPALVQIMAWRRPGDKPLSETMMVSLLRHICITRPQWVKPQCLHRIITWCAVHCFSSVHCTQCIVQI